MTQRPPEFRSPVRIALLQPCTEIALDGAEARGADAPMCLRRAIELAGHVVHSIFSHARP